MGCVHKTTIALVVFLLAFAHIGRAIGQSDDKTIERSVAIGSYAGVPTAYVSLGDLEGGVTFKIKLELRNTSGRDFDIRKMETGCNCIKVKLAENSIPSGGSGHLDLTLSTDEVAEHATRTYGFSIFYSDSESIQVRVDYSISGMVSFRGVSSFLTSIPIGQTSHVFRVPLLVTEPVKVNDLEITLGESFRGMRTQVIVENDLQFLECTFVVPSDRKESYMDTITIADRKTKKQAVLGIVIELVSLVSIAPLTVLFVPREEDQAFESQVLIRVNRKMLVFPKGDKQPEIMPEFRFKVPGGNLSDTKIMRLSQGIYRAKLQWKPRDAEPFEKISKIEVEVETPLDRDQRALSVRFLE